MKFGDLGGSHTHLGQTKASIGQCRTEICCLLGPQTKLQGISEKSENLLNVEFLEASTRCMKMLEMGQVLSRHMMKIKYEHIHFDLFEGFFLTAQKHPHNSRLPKELCRLSTVIPRIGDVAYKHALPENMFVSWRHGQFRRGWWNTIGTGLDSMGVKI